MQALLGGFEFSLAAILLVLALSIFLAAAALSSSPRRPFHHVLRAVLSFLVLLPATSSAQWVNWMGATGMPNGISVGWVMGPPYDYCTPGSYNVKVYRSSDGYVIYDGPAESGSALDTTAAPGVTHAYTLMGYSTNFYDPCVYYVRMWVDYASALWSPPPPTLSAYYSPSTDLPGAPYTLYWSSTNATSVTWVATGAFSGSGSLDPPAGGTGSSTIPYGTTNVTFTATGPGGTAQVNATLTGACPFGTAWDGSSCVAVSPSPAVGVSASDGSFSDRIRISFSGPNQSAMCSSVNYVIVRGGTDVGTVTTVPVGGGAGSFDDTGVAPGTQTYSVRSVCANGATATSGSDTGFKQGIPSASTGVSASDGSFADRVRVTFSAPDQSGQCTSASYVVVRNSSDVGTITTIPLTGGGGSFDDTTAGAGTHTYSIRSVCTPGGATASSSSDTGFIAVNPLAATAVSATDGSFADRVRVSFTAPDQTSYCPSVTYTIVRNGADQYAPAVALTGGPVSWDDTGVGAGTYTYSVRSDCVSYGTSASSSSDTGYKLGTPLAATAVSATDGVYGDRVRVTFTGPSQSAQCTSIQYVVVRNSTDVGTVVTVPLAGGAGSFDDTGAPAGTHTYSVRSVCAPGGSTAVSASDTGYKVGTPLAVTGVAASDGTFSDRIRITFTAPNQSSQCTAATYTIVRDGADVATDSSIPLTGGVGSYDDMAAPIGTRAYSVRTECSPGIATAVSAGDTGFRAGTPLPVTSVVASDGAFATKVAVTFNAPDQSAYCSSISYVVTRNGSDLATITTVPLTGGAGSYDDLTVPVGVQSYAVRSVCAPGGVAATSATDGGFKLGTPAPATAVSASDGTFSGKVVVTFTGPDQSSQCTSVDYVVLRNGATVGSVSTVPVTGGAGTYDDTTAPAGTHTYAVRAECAPGSATALSSTDTGYILVPPLAVTGLAASDGTFPSKVAVSFTAPDQSALCASIQYVVTRDAADLATITTIPLTGGAGAYDDTTASAGTHTYGVRSVCSPGGGTATSATDTGFKLGTPSPATAVSASDGSFSTLVRVTFTAPDQSPQCSAVTYTVVRGGTTDLGSVSVALTGGAGVYDDVTAPAGSQTYAVRATCTPGNQTSLSASDTGYKTGTPSPATSVAASDGTYPSRIVVTFNAPNQTAVCSSTDYVLVRDGSDLATISTMPVSGGPATYDDTTASIGVHSYSVRSVCTPGNATSVSAADSGYRAGSPAAPTGLTASDGTFSTKVAISFAAPDQSSQCTSISYVLVRDGTDTATLSTVPLTGGPVNFDDTGVAPGVHLYEVRSVCSPGNTTAISNSDSGHRLGSPLAPSVLAASDGAFATHVALTFTAPDQSAECGSVVYTVVRDSVDISNISTIPLTGGASSFDDTTASSGPHTYAIRVACTPGAQTATSTTDSGYRLGSALAPSAVAASDGMYTDKVRVTWTAPDQSAECSSVQYIVTREGVDVGTVNTIPVAGGAGSFDDTLVPSGTFTYAVRAVCTPGNGSVVSATDTGFKTQACDPMVLSGPQGTGPLPATITWNAANGATEYQVFQADSLGGPYGLLATVPLGTTSYSVAGWPKKFMRVTCVASAPVGNAISPSIQVWGNTLPVIAPDTFDAVPGATTTVTPVVTDPDGNTTFVLAVAVPPANGAVVINGATFDYTPNVGFQGDDPFTLSATDPQGGVGTGVLTARVAPIVPAVPTNVKATDGTRLNDVQVTWDVVLYATSYDVYMGTSATDDAPTLVGNVTAPQVNFDHTAAIAGQINWYSVLARNGTVTGPRSAADSGLRDTAPINLSASGSAEYTGLVDMAPLVTDPDPGEVLVFTVETQPTYGTASFITGMGRFRYVANGSYLGLDTFTIRATDRAGAFVIGTATVDVSCQQHNATTISVPSRTFVGGAYRARLTYNTFDCPATYSATIDVMSGATTVDTQAQSGLPSGTSMPLNFDLVAPATEGTYSLQIRLRNNLTGQEILRTSTLIVESFRMPPVAWKDTTTLAGIENVTLNVGAASQCTLTTDDATARANVALCLATAEQLPAEVTVDTGATLPTWRGVPATAATYPVVVRVLQYDYAGLARELGTTNVPLSVVQPSAIVYQSPANISSKQAIEVYKITPTQQSGLTCNLFTDVPSAASAIATGRRACVLSWTSTDTEFNSDGRQLTGVIFGTAPVTNTWTLNLVKADSSLLPIGTGSTIVTPTPISLGFNLVPSPSDPIAMVTSVNINVGQTGTDKCVALTPKDATASTLPSRPCLFEFGTVSGMTSDLAGTVPVLRGRLPSSPTTVPYTVSIYYNGTKHLIMTGQQDIATMPATPPVINFEYVRQVAPDVFAVSVLGGSMGVIASDTSRGELIGTHQVQGVTDPTTFVLYGSKRRQVVPAGPATLYSTRTVDVSMAYQAVPTISSTRTVTILSVPRDGLRLELLSPPASAPDTAPVTVSAGIREMTTSGLQYVAANAGQWEITFGEVSSTGVFTAISAPIATDSSGVASTSVDLAGRTVLRLAAHATPVSGGTGYTTTLRSRMSVIAVSKGTAIEGSVASIGPTDGPAPYLTTLRIVFATRADQIANQSVTWYQSSDGGATWATPVGAVGLQFSPRLAVGDYLFRVKFVNINTGEESFSPNLALKAYPVPKLTLSGPTYLLPGTPGEFTGSATDVLGSPMPDAVWSWELQRRIVGGPTTVLTSGTTLPIPVDPPESGVYRLVVKARSSTSSDADPRAWGMAVVQVVSGVPGKPVVRITGPLRLETGKPGTYVATTATTFALTSSNLLIDGVWTLPDGSTVPGTTLTWTPSTADFALSRTPTLSYSAWIVGYESETRNTAIITPSLWQYVWPTWKVTKGLGSTYAPAGVQLVVGPTDPTLLAVLEGLTYDWTVPNTIRITNSPTSKLTGIVDYGGTHDVQVRVSDARGNTQLLAESVTVNDPPPLTVDTTIVNLNKWSHAPMNIAMSVKTMGGHPLDGVNSWTYFVNGVQQDVPNQYYARLALDAPGTYEVEARVGTRMGATASKISTVVVPTNTAPTCGITGTVALNRRSIALKGNCVDTDGTLVNYKWFINGQPAPVLASGSWTYMLPTGVDLPVNVEVIVTDNGGLTGTSSVVFP